MTSNDGDTRAAGRPRDTAIDRALADACRSLLVERGYHDLSIEAVAQRAGVGRPAVYRRWPSKAHMVFDVAYSIPASEAVLPDGEDFEAFIEMLIEQNVAFFGRPEVAAAVPGLIGEWQKRSEIRTEAAKTVRAPIHTALADRVSAAAAAGEIHPEVDPDLLLDTIVGAVMFVVSAGGVDDTTKFARDLAQLLLRGMLERQQEGKR